MVDRISHPGFVVHLRYGRALGWHPRPVHFPGSASVNPVPDEFNLLRRQGPAGVNGRHPEGRVAGADFLIELTGGAVAGNDDSVAASVGECAFPGVESQIGLTRVGVGAVASKTLIRKNRAYLAAEIGGRGSRTGGGGGTRGP